MSLVLRFLPFLQRSSEFTVALSALYRRKLTTMQLPPEQMVPLLTPPLLKLSGIFCRHGYELRIAGGAVRDLLAGGLPHDLDLATTATPDQMKSMFAEESAAARAARPDGPEHGGLRLFNTNGERHGTVSLRVDDLANFEVTTLRTDVVTDGRKAQVKFVEDWRLDAQRRDLTVNALFLGLDGTVFDYCGGCEDLRARRIRFNGDPAVRISEDFLRILRYFRFYGRLASEPDSHDPALLETISELGHGLLRVSGERLWMELRQILAGRFREHVLPRMCDCGIGVHLGLPDCVNLERFSAVCRHCDLLEESAGEGCDPLPPANPMVLVAAMLDSREQLMELHSRLKLSAMERDMALFIIEHRLSSPPEQQLHYQKLLAASPFTGRYGNLYVVSLMYSDLCPAALVRRLRAWAVPAFPLGGHDLMQAGVPRGRSLGRVMEALRQLWADAEFGSSREELLEHVPRLFQPRSPQNRKRRAPSA